MLITRYQIELVNQVFKDLGLKETARCENYGNAAIIFTGTNYEIYTSDGKEYHIFYKTKNNGKEYTSLIASNKFESILAMVCSYIFEEKAKQSIGIFKNSKW